MANVNETNETGNSHGNAVFILSLPPENVKEALNRFPKECISDYFHDEAGLIINFKRFNQAVQFVSRSHMINISGRDFEIYLATSVTVHDIATYTEDIKNIMESHGYPQVMHFYPIEELEDEQSRSFKLLKDYRVILKIPELFAVFDLTKIWWNGRSFDVSFFCHFCKENGHKAFQCKKCPTLIFEQPHLGKQTNPGTSGPQRRNFTTAQSQQRKNRRIASLNEEIRRAVAKVVENPEPLITYLNNVRRKGDKKLSEMTNSYTHNIPDLMEVLDKIVNTYEFAILKKNKRSTKDEKNDVKFLKNLSERLEKEFMLRIGIS